jgi:hypothetical protein
MEIINKLEYVKGDYIIDNAPIYCKGCRNARDLIRKKNIHPENYIYARLDKNTWILSNGLSIKYDKIFILKKFVDSIPELNININEIIKTDDGIEKAPNIIILNDKEKLKDNEGNIIEIEVRGMREVDKIFFKVKDVEKGFNITRLQDVLISDENNYLLKQHYDYFICEKNTLNGKNNNKTNKEKIKKTLFLTYEGLMRVLFVSKNNKTSKFLKWAIHTLFTVHLGSDEQKNTLISKMKGIEYSKIQDYFSIIPHDISCVYLTYLNDVKILRDKMNIDLKYHDNSKVYKFGLTESLERRKNEHKREFKNIEKFIDLKLVQYSMIDKQFLTKAEKDIKNEYQDNIIEYENMTEIIILNDDEFKKIKKSYEILGYKYSGSNQELHKEIEKLKHEMLIKDEKHLHEIQILNKIHENEMLKLELNFYKNK